MRNPKLIPAGLAFLALAAGVHAQSPCPAKASRKSGPSEYQVECRVFHIADMKRQSETLDVFQAPRLTLADGQPADVQVAPAKRDGDGGLRDSGFVLFAKVETLPANKWVKLEAQVQLSTRVEPGKGGLYAVGKGHAGNPDAGRPGSQVKREIRGYEQRGSASLHDGSCVVSKSFNLVEQLRCGQTVKVVLETDGCGTPKTWAELTVRKAEPSAAEVTPAPACPWSGPW